MSRLLLGFLFALSVSGCCCQLNLTGLDGGAGGGGGGSATGGGPGGGGGSAGGGGTIGTPPTIGSPATPSSGAYGSYLTILGANFGDAGTLELATGSGPLVLSSGELKADAGELWHSDKIVFRYPFPAEGNIRVKNGSGAGADAGAFVPSWIPGAGLAQDQDIYTPFPSSFLAAPGTVVGTIRYPDTPLVYGGWGILVHDGTNPRLFKITGPSGFGPVLSLNLVPGPGVQPDGVALVKSGLPDGGTLRTVMRVVWNAGLPDLQSTGVTAHAALGGGFDPLFYAWTVAADGGLVRLRPAAPAWTADKTLAPPPGFGVGGKTSQFFFVGSTPAVQWTVGRSSGFQYYEHPEYALANPAQTGWLPTEVAAGEIEGEVDGVNLHTTADGRLTSVYSGGFFSVVLGRSVIPIHIEVRRPDGGFLPGPTLDAPGGGPFVLAPTATAYAGAAWSSAGLRVVPALALPLDGGQVAATETEIAVWPRPQLSWQVVPDADGGVMVLLEHNFRLYLVKKR